MNITEFLEARIDDDERRAGSGWSRLGDTRWETTNEGQDILTPSAVLGECAAKRAIVAEHPNSNVNFPRQVPICDTCHDYDHHDAIFWPCPTIKALAAVYKDHSDYRQEWAL